MASEFEKNIGGGSRCPILGLLPGWMSVAGAMQAAPEEDSLLAKIPAHAHLNSFLISLDLDAQHFHTKCR